jgi:endonuclease III
MKDNQDNEQLKIIAERLKLEYGHSVLKPNVFNTETIIMAGLESEPLDGLIETILSHQSPNAVTHRMGAALRTAYPDWEDALTAGAEGIQQVLQNAKGNLTKNKSGYIYGVLSHLKKERGELSLSFLRSYKLQDARNLLLSFKGVGAKTASCVLLFNLQLPAMPVDTHVLRIAQRLKLVNEKLKPDKVETWFEENLPQTWAAHYEFHLNAIAHGQITCKALNPKCDRCVLKDLCPSADII